MSHDLAVLVCTEGRQAFLPWLAWNIARQRHLDWPRATVVVASSDPGDLQRLAHPDMRCAIEHLPTRPGDSVPRKRNQLLRAARDLGAEFFAWMDDDDWHAPQRLHHALELLTDSHIDYAVNRGPLPYYRLGTSVSDAGWCEVVSMRKRPIPITVVGRTERLAPVSFDESVIYGSDTLWLDQIERTRRLKGTTVQRLRPYFFSVRHGRNMSRHTGAFRYSRHPAELRKLLTPTAWGDTGVQLEALRDRLYST